MEVIIEYHVWRILKTNNFFFYSYKIKLLINFISENIKNQPVFMPELRNSRWETVKASCGSRYTGASA